MVTGMVTIPVEMVNLFRNAPPGLELLNVKEVTNKFQTTWLQKHEAAKLERQCCSSISRVSYGIMRVGLEVNVHFHTNEST